MIYARRYLETDAEQWNHFLADAKNSTFLFARSYMDYHKKKFQDYSIMVFENEKLLALMPASFSNGVIYSHQGLTYGGIIVKRQEYSINTIRFFKEILKFLSQQGIEKMIFKQIPAFYNSVGSDEIDYALFLLNAKLIRMDIASVISLTGPTISYQERRSRSIKKAIKAGVIVSESNSFDDFWNLILVPNLLQRHGVKPVHTLEEIYFLSKENKGCIRQFNAYLNDRILAGCTTYETNNVVHGQYISASEEGRDTGAIDLLFDWLIRNIFKHKSFFDFGIANENDGRTINKGLLEWKEGFGARPYAHRFYEVELAKFEMLNI